jgi:SAM-dependent methyltransferase
MISSDSRKRFTSRVEDYRKYRPGYPSEALTFIRDTCRATRAWTIADVGAGTGISSSALIGCFGVRVYAIEPNGAMLAEAKRTLSMNPLFVPVGGSAEATTLDDGSVDLVCSFQAFHWFDLERARAELRRILRPPRWAALIWNDRDLSTPFLKGYEEMLRELPEYRRVDHKNLGTDHFRRFFGGESIIEEGFANSQKFDLEGLIGRHFSSSYAAERGTQEFGRQTEILRRLFGETQKDGLVEFLLTTKVYLGQIA